MENNLSGAYPIARFLTSLMERSGQCRTEFVRCLGYRNMERGRKRLDAWLDQGEGYSKIISQIAARFPSAAEELYAAIAATKHIRAAEAEAAFLAQRQAEQDIFVPHIIAEGEHTVPASICFYAVSGAKSDLIELPDHILALSVEDQLAALPNLMCSYRTRHNGQVPFFGNLTGFKFVRLLDYFQFDEEGRLKEHLSKPFRRGIGYVQLL